MLSVQVTNDWSYLSLVCVLVTECNGIKILNVILIRSITVNILC